jgi:hypothetical protein
MRAHTAVRPEDRHMDNILPFKKPRAADKARGQTLCRRGFHKWVVSKQQQFDTKQGRLVTVYACDRCGAVKTTAH